MSDRCPAKLSHAGQMHACEQPPGHPGWHRLKSIIGEVTWSGPEVHYGEESRVREAAGRVTEGNSNAETV